MNGADVLLLVNTGTTDLPVYTAVGSQRNVSIEETTEEIDESSKNSRAKRVAAGRYGATLSLDALYVPDDVSYLALKSAHRNGELIKVRVSENGVAVEEADALITKLSREFPDQEEATIAIDLTIDGEWTELSS